MTTFTDHITTLKSRTVLERGIIGSAICNISAALAAADILTETNFQDPLCHRVFPILIEGIDTLEIDLVDITRKYRKRYGEDKAYELTYLTEVSEYGQFARFPLSECLLLLETDIREKFHTLLTRMEKQCAKASEFESASIWKSCADHMVHPGNDVFQAVDHLHAYLKSCFPDQMEDYNRLYEAVPKMAERIRKRARTRKFLDTLTVLEMESVTHEQRMCVKILSDWLIMCMGAKKLPENFYSTISQLNTTWNA